MTTAFRWVSLIATRSPILPVVGAIVAAAYGYGWHGALIGIAAGLAATAVITLAATWRQAPSRQKTRTFAALAVSVFAAVWFATHR